MLRKHVSCSGRHEGDQNSEVVLDVFLQVNRLIVDPLYPYGPIAPSISLD